MRNLPIFRKFGRFCICQFSCVQPIHHREWRVIVTTRCNNLIDAVPRRLLWIILTMGDSLTNGKLLNQLLMNFCTRIRQLDLCIHSVSIKKRVAFFDYMSCFSIDFYTFALLQTWTNIQQKVIKICNFALNVFTHYLTKLRKQHKNSRPLFCSVFYKIGRFI